MQEQILSRQEGEMEAQFVAPAEIKKTPGKWGDQKKLYSRQMAASGGQNE